MSTAVKSIAVHQNRARVTRMVDVSASQGHIVPAAISYRGNFFFASLGTFPVVPGREVVLKLTPSGTCSNGRAAS